MPWKAKKIKSAYNLWTKLSLASFVATAILLVVAIILVQTKGIEFQIHWLFLGGAAFAFFGAMGAVKEGRFFAQFTDFTRQSNPITFWTQATICYSFATALFALFLYGLLM